tara:strand:- start:368 stop:1732 length:1365 start_codon:yes stop_codon:yes gene_type:complete
MYNIGKSVNSVVIPDLVESTILESIIKAQENDESELEAQKKTAIEFYFNDNLDAHIEAWFSGDSLGQVPTFPQRIVPRFAKSRMMLYKKPPSRLINGEEDEIYKQLTYKINTSTRTFAELAWLLGCCHMKSCVDEHRKRIYYEILPNVKEYYIQGETEPFAYSWEIDKDISKKYYVFWSEPRDGLPGMHFQFDQDGKRTPVYGNEEMINPYGMNPISRIEFTSNAYDVVRASVHIGIAMTEIALGVRFKLGQPVFTGIDEGQSKIKSGIDNAIILPEGASFNYVSPSGSVIEMIESVKAFANQTAENNHLRIRWGESGGNVPSGEALRILEIENLETRESDEAMFREWENSRYAIDRTLAEVHGLGSLPDNFHVDFGEVTYPMSPKEERDWLDWKIDNGIMSQKDLLLYFNPDMSAEELESKMNEVQEEKRIEKENSAPPRPTFGGLSNLGATG